MINRPPNDDEERQARERGRLGEERAEQRQDLDVEWQEGGRVDYLIDILAATRREFTADDVWNVLDNNIENGLLEPVENRRVLGPILSRAARRGTIAKTNRTVPSVRRNAAPIPVWRTADPHWNNGRSEMQRRRTTQAVRTALDEVIAEKRRLLREANEEKERLERELQDDVTSRREYDSRWSDFSSNDPFRGVTLESTDEGEMIATMDDMEFLRRFNQDRNVNLKSGQIVLWRDTVNLDNSDWDVFAIKGDDWNVEMEGSSRLGSARSAKGVMILFQEVGSNREAGSLFVNTSDGIEQHKVEINNEFGTPDPDAFDSGLADKIANFSRNLMTTNEQLIVANMDIFSNWHKAGQNQKDLLSSGRAFRILDPIPMQTAERSGFEQQRVDAILESTQPGALGWLERTFSDWEGADALMKQIYSEPDLLQWVVNNPTMLNNIIVAEMEGALSDFGEQILDFDFGEITEDVNSAMEEVESAVEDQDLDRLRKLGFATGYYEENIINSVLDSVSDEVVKDKKMKARRSNIGVKRSRNDPIRRNLWKERMLSNPMIQTRESGRRVYRRRISHQDFLLRGLSQNKNQAKRFAQIVRSKGFNARVIPVKRGHGVYVGGRKK